MNITRRAAAVGGLGLLAGTSVKPATVLADWGENLAAPFTGLEEFWLATDAYIFG